MMHTNSPFKLLSRTLVSLAIFLASASTTYAATVTATWDTNPETDINGYLLSWGTAVGQHPNTVDVGNVTTWQLTLAPGFRYYFVVQAYNTSGGISGPSSEVFADVGITAPSITSLSLASAI